MNLRSKFFEKLATKWLKKQEQARALKSLGEKFDWKTLAKKCHDKISMDYRFWISKKDSVQRNSKLADITKDVAFMNSIEGKNDISKMQEGKLHEIKNKYGVD